ncbi:carbon starvation CstA family protein [Candidatus Macondimonas diazotrophica]
MLFFRTGDAPSLAIGMASIFSSAFGESLHALWLHFVIMVEAVAGRRVGGFLLQDLLGAIWEPLGRRRRLLLSSARWSWPGAIPAQGCGRSQQRRKHPLAAIALSVATGILVESGRLR